MSGTSQSTAAPDRASPAIFERVLIGVDGRQPSFDACRQAARLAAPGTRLEAATVTLFPPATAAALGVPELADSIEQDAGSVLQAAARILGEDAELRRLDGFTVDALLAELKRLKVTLLALGAPAHRRVDEMIFGGIADELLHKAPCSVFVARRGPDEKNFPTSIVVGIDGCAEADRAYEVASELAASRHSTLRSVEASEAPVPALVASSKDADLLVVGSRGLHGPRVLGSVSERLAYQAPSSVLIVR